MKGRRRHRQVNRIDSHLQIRLHHHRLLLPGLNFGVEVEPGELFLHLPLWFLVLHHLDVQSVTTIEIPIHFFHSSYTMKGRKAKRNFNYLFDSFLWFDGANILSRNFAVAGMLHIFVQLYASASIQFLLSCLCKFFLIKYVLHSCLLKILHLTKIMQI